MQQKHLHHDIFEFLCLMDARLLRSDGQRIQQSKTIELIGFTKGSASRILNREFDTISEDNLSLIVAYFGISKPQARGEIPLPERFISTISLRMAFTIL